MVTEQGRQPTEAAKELGICIDTLRSWLKRRLALSGNRKRPVYQEDCGVRILRALKQALRADRHAAGAYGPGNGIPPPQASKRQFPPGLRRSAMCLPIWSLSTIPAALTPLWVGFLPLVSRRNFATPLPNHRYHIPRQSFQVFSCFSVRFSGSCPHTNITPGQFPTAHFHYGTFPLPDSPQGNSIYNSTKK